MEGSIALETGAGPLLKTWHTSGHGMYSSCASTKEHQQWLPTRGLQLLLVLFALSACQQGMVRDQAFEENVADPQPAEQASTLKPDAAPKQRTAVRIPATQPSWHTGDRWLWSDGYGLEATATEGETTILNRLDAENQWQRREGLFVVESRDMKTHRRVVFRSRNPADLFPLKVGNQVVFKREYLANGALRVHRTSWVVEGLEEIEVPAGRFECWVITRRSRSLQSDWTSYERLWFSPEVKNYIRMEYRYGRNPASSRVLMSYRLTP